MRTEEQLDTIRSNRRRMLLLDWKKQQAAGTTLSAYCRSLGFDPELFCRFLKSKDGETVPGFDMLDVLQP